MNGTLVGRSTGGKWVPAPAGSHLDEFTFFDARVFNNQWAANDLDENGMMMLYGMPEAEIERLIAIGSAGESTLKVRFGDGSEYEYHMTDHDRLESIFNLMKASDHPGAIIWSNLIYPQVDYRQTVERTGGYVSKVSHAVKMAWVRQRQQQQRRDPYRQ